MTQPKPKTSWALSGLRRRDDPFTFPFAIVSGTPAFVATVNSRKRSVRRGSICGMRLD